MSNFTKKHNNCEFFQEKNHNNDVFYLTLNPALVFSWHRYLFAKNHIAVFLELDKLTMIRFLLLLFLFLLF